MSPGNGAGRTGANERNETMFNRHHTTRATLALAACPLFLLAACGEETPLVPQDAGDKARDVVREIGDAPPAEQAVVMIDGSPVVIWPYTGTSFDGAAVDPVNVVFVGADPVQVRTALMGLDGDRSAFGIPPVAPFDAPWQDAIGGDVQTTCAPGGDGWVASIVQLTLGEYGPLRVHLRLFATGLEIGGRPVTLGGAHFELQIPGTTEHQVLSWELAEQIVTADMMRTGRLDMQAPLYPTGPINAAPSWRAIDPMIYNMLPPELVGLIQGPAQPADAPVPLPSDGQGTVFSIVGAPVPAPGAWTHAVTITYDQLVPRPFCAEGPGDWLMVAGPVDFRLRVEVSAEGVYTVHSSYEGVIEALPVDLSGGAPVPVGDPFTARVSGRTNGMLAGSDGRIVADDRRFTHEADGNQVLDQRLNVPRSGPKTYRVALSCIDDL